MYSGEGKSGNLIISAKIISGNFANQFVAQVIHRCVHTHTLATLDCFKVSWSGRQTEDVNKPGRRIFSCHEGPVVYLV